MRKQHGRGRKKSEAALKTRFAPMRWQDLSSAQDSQEFPGSGAGKRGHPRGCAAEHLLGPEFDPDKRCRGDAFREPFVAEKEAVKEHAQRSNPGMVA